MHSKCIKYNYMTVIHKLIPIVLVNALSFLHCLLQELLNSSSVLQFLALSLELASFAPSLPAHYVSYPERRAHSVQDRIVEGFSWAIFCVPGNGKLPLAIMWTDGRSFFYPRKWETGHA